MITELHRTVLPPLRLNGKASALGGGFAATIRVTKRYSVIRASKNTENGLSVELLFVLNTPYDRS